MNQDNSDEAEEMTAPLLGMAGAAVVLVVLCAVGGFVLGLLHQYFNYYRGRYECTCKLD